jgi:hypothetical protein
LSRKKFKFLKKIIVSLRPSPHVLKKVSKIKILANFFSKVPHFASSTLRAWALRRRGINSALDQRGLQPLWKPCSRELPPFEPRSPFIPTLPGGVFWRVFIKIDNFSSFSNLSVCLIGLGKKERRFGEISLNDNHRRGDGATEMEIEPLTLV